MDTGPTRPSHTAHDHRVAGHAAVPVRIRDQHRYQAPADRAAHGRSFQVRADDRRGAAEHPLLRHHTACLRSRGRTRAGQRHRALRHKHSARFRSVGRSRRKADDPDGRRCDRSINDRQRRGCARGADDRTGSRSAARDPVQTGQSAVPVRGARPVQPRTAHRAEYRAGTDPGGPDDVDPVRHDIVDHPRARAWHDGEPARHAGPTHRGDAGQGRAHIVIGYVQVTLIVVIAALVFGLPIRGSIPLLALALGLFIASNLALGITFSTVARNQMQATQMAQFMLLPSFFLSGFMFPFKGMPVWAQWLGELFPMTHALRIARGLLLKGNGLAEIAPELWPIAAFTLVVTVIATFSYRETLD